MYPDEFIERIGEQSYVDPHGLMEAMSQPARASVRVNRRKWDQGITGYESVPWESDGYFIPGKPLYTPDPLLHAGVYYPQESSSMFAGEFFRQMTDGKSGLRVLDLCGAPGGKSTHLSTLIGDDGLLVANEVIRARAAVLAENITKWGIGNTVVTQGDPARFAALPEFFDVIVADVPCSGEGMFRSAAIAREWSVQNTRLCSDRQRRIVMEAWPSLKAGGIMIYSTCTFNPAENEENIAWIRDSTDAEPLNVSLSEGSGIIPVSHKSITGYGFHPGRVQGDGFFIAAIKKGEGRSNRNQDAAIKKGEGRSNRNQGATPQKIESHSNKKHDTRKGAIKPSSTAYGIAEPLTSFDRNRLIMMDNRIIALATETDVFNYLNDRINVIKAGTLIGEVKNSVLVPAHDLAMSVRQKRGAWPEHALPYDEAFSFLRLEQLRPGNMPAGRVLLTYRGVPLGFVNNLGSRVNNGYPQAWRIRMEKPTDYRGILKEIDC